MPLAAYAAGGIFGWGLRRTVRGWFLIGTLGGRATATGAFLNPATNGIGHCGDFVRIPRPESVIELDAVSVDEACLVRASPNDLNDAALIEGSRVAGNLVLAAAQDARKNCTSFATGEGEPIASSQEVETEEFGFLGEGKAEGDEFGGVEEFTVFDLLAVDRIFGVLEFGHGSFNPLWVQLDPRQVNCIKPDGGRLVGLGCVAVSGRRERAVQPTCRVTY